MLLLLSVLLIWQHVRYELVSDCLERGGTWDGPGSRCKLILPIYLERGIKRSELARRRFQSAASSPLRTGRYGKASGR